MLIIGSGPAGHQLIERMRQVPEYGLHPAGVLDGIAPADMEVLGVPYLGTADDLESAARATGAEELIVAPSSTSDEQLARTAQQAQNLGMRVRVVPRLMDAVGVGAWVEHLGGIPLMVLWDCWSSRRCSSGSYSWSNSAPRDRSCSVRNESGAMARSSTA